MKTRYLISLLAVATLLAACAPKSTSSDAATLAPVITETLESLEPTSAPSEETAVTSVPIPAGNVFDVEISGFAFAENTITIKVGDSVTWTNHYSATHTVVADDGSFKSGNLKNDDSFSQTFDTAGTYTYQCGLHSSMTGTVIVEP